MGSPNFLTAESCISNFGIEFDSSESENLFYMDERDELGEKLDHANDNLTFFKLYERPGYHSGFQIYLEQLNSADYFWNNYARYWSVDEEIGFYNDAGEWVEVSLSKKHTEALKNENFCLEDLKEVLNLEEEKAKLLIQKIAKAHGLGEVIGKNFSSSVNYDWLKA
ncbi:MULTISPECIES: hypothetical protein [Acinetobacter]|jgi:hypothetical protein|uniref:hypothetical protein n=1 Tax=Acinetobacter TaxID=469 RepID=UPI00289C78A4|nr:hypothetical protein [Acinetobacter variabilis]